MIIKTIGSGGDYTDIGLAWASIPFTVDDDYTFNIISDFSETTGIPISQVKNFVGHTITIQDIGRLYKIATAVVYSIPSNSTAAICIINGLTINYSGTNNALFRPHSAGTPINLTCYFKNLTLIGTAVANDGSYAFRIDDYNKLKIYILNCRVSKFYSGVNFTSLNPDNGVDRIVENCVFYKCGYGVTFSTSSASIYQTVKNTVCVGSFVKDFADAGAGNTHNKVINCADSDNTIIALYATKTACITGIVDGDFLSVDSANANFLKINKTSTLWEKGTTTISAWNTSDIGGFPRPHVGNKVNIGINEDNNTKTVTFTDTSRGLIERTDFDFGDGSVHATTLPADHEYDLDAIVPPYTVDATLIATDTKGNSDTITKTIDLS